MLKGRHLHKDLFAQSGSKVYRGTDYGSRAYADQAVELRRTRARSRGRAGRVRRRASHITIIVDEHE